MKVDRKLVGLIVLAIVVVVLAVWAWNNWPYGVWPNTAPKAAVKTTTSSVASEGKPEVKLVTEYVTVTEKITVTVPVTVATTAAPVATTPQAPQAPAGTAAWTPAQKCNWLRANLPQTDTGVQEWVAKLTNNKIPPRRVTIHKYQCGDGTEVFDGGIINGPVEGWNDPFTVSVPSGGVVDAYPGATFSGEHFPLSAATERASSGSVTAVRATVWPWWDERPPVVTTSQAAPAPTPTIPPTIKGTAPAPTATMAAATNCIKPDVLANQKGWQGKYAPNDPYGAFVVSLNTEQTLPPSWEAIGAGNKHIYNTDTNRAMSPGTWSIYTPFDCREALGYSK